MEYVDNIVVNSHSGPNMLQNSAPYQPIASCMTMFDYKTYTDCISVKMVPVFSLSKCKPKSDQRWKLQKSINTAGIEPNYR